MSDPFSQRAQSAKNIAKQRHATQRMRWRPLFAAAPAAIAIVIGALLLVIMMSNAARLSPAALQQRASRNLERGAAADATVDYRRLLQRSPADVRYRAGLAAALQAHAGSAAP